MELNTGIEVINPSGTTFLSPDSTICRIIDKVFIVFGQQPICLNNNYAFENYLDDDAALDTAKRTAMKEYIAKYHKTGYTEADYDKLPASERWQVRELMKESFSMRTVAWNQNRRGQFVLHNHIDDNERLYVATVGHGLRAAVSDTLQLPEGGFKQYKDNSVINIWFEVPGATGKRYDTAYEGDTPERLKQYIKNPYWGYLIVGAI